MTIETDAMHLFKDPAVTLLVLGLYASYCASLRGSTTKGNKDPGASV